MSNNTEQNIYGLVKVRKKHGPVKDQDGPEKKEWEKRKEKSME